MKELWLDIVYKGKMVRINSKGEIRAKLSSVSDRKGYTKSKTTEVQKKKYILGQQSTSQCRKARPS